MGVSTQEIRAAGQEICEERGTGGKLGPANLNARNDAERTLETIKQSIIMAHRACGVEFKRTSQTGEEFSAQLENGTALSLKVDSGRLEAKLQDGTSITAKVQDPGDDKPLVLTLNDEMMAGPRLEDKLGALLTHLNGKIAASFTNAPAPARNAGTGASKPFKM